MRYHLKICEVIFGKSCYLLLELYEVPVDLSYGYKVQKHYRERKLADFVDNCDTISLKMLM